MFDHDPLDDVRPLEEVAGLVRLALSDQVTDRLELEKELLEPQLVDLVDDDEQELVVSGWVGFRGLRGEDALELEIGTVGETATLFAELAIERLIRQSGALPVDGHDRHTHIDHVVELDDVRVRHADAAVRGRGAERRDVLGPVEPNAGRRPVDRA